MSGISTTQLVAAARAVMRPGERVVVTAPDVVMVVPVQLAGEQAPGPMIRRARARK